MLYIGIKKATAPIVKDDSVMLRVTTLLHLPLTIQTFTSTLILWCYNGHSHRNLYCPSRMPAGITSKP